MHVGFYSLFYFELKGKIMAPLIIYIRDRERGGWRVFIKRAQTSPSQKPL